MSLRGYDHWKTTEPDDGEGGGECEHCGTPLTKDAWPSHVWFCERCEDHIDPDAAYDAWRERDDARHGRLSPDHVAWEPPLPDDSEDPDPPF